MQDFVQLDNFQKTAEKNWGLEEAVIDFCV
jgi:hypothetical protein